MAQQGAKWGAGKLNEILAAIELIQSTDISAGLLTVFFNLFEAFQNLLG